MGAIVRAPIRVRFDERETGWALPLEHGRALIANIPLTDRCNLRDVVTLEDEGGSGLPRVGQVVDRHYAAKSVLYYSHRHEFTRLCHHLERLGCETEGGQHPSYGQPGILLVAHDETICPAELARAIGIPQPGDEVREIDHDAACRRDSVPPASCAGVEKACAPEELDVRLAATQHSRSGSRA